MPREIRWSKEEIDYLKNNYSTKNINELLIALNRSKDGIHHKAMELGLKKEGKVYTGEFAGKRWKGGKTHKICKGKKYFIIYSPYHPYKDNKGYVMEHRLIMEKKIKRFLLPSEVVHHIDGNTQNNKINNLELFENQSKHFSHHQVWEKNVIK